MSHVAVVMVATSRPQALEAALASLRAQTLKGTLYLVNNSGGPLFALCHHLAFHMNGWETEVITLTARWGRIGIPFNAGYYRAKAQAYDHIIKMDDDVVIPAYAIDSLTARKGITALAPQGGGEKYDAVDIPTRKLGDKCPLLFGACFSVDAESSSKLGYFQEDFDRGIDHDYGLRAAQAGIPIIYLPGMCADHSNGDTPSEGSQALKYMKNVAPFQPPEDGTYWKSTVWENESFRTVAIEQSNSTELS